MKLETFDEVLQAAKAKHVKEGRKFHLLLGNGFSMAYDPEIFSYNALHDFISNLDDEQLGKLLGIIQTKNFELIMQQLDNFAALIDAFGPNDDLKTRVTEASKKLKYSLLDAVQALHPEHVFTIPQNKNDACATFLKTFLEMEGQIYTTNYDLLLYWVLMRNMDNNNIKSIDGFGRNVVNPDNLIVGEEPEYSELQWGKFKETQDTFYLHGALQLFDAGVEVIKEEYNHQHNLLESIVNRIDHGEYPIFVTAGNGREKLTHIMHNKYLAYCFDSLSTITGSLVTFGFNFGEYDDHIIDAINVAAKHGQKIHDRLWSIYIGVYSDKDKLHIEQIATRFKCKVHIFDAKTAKVWG